MCVFMRVQPCNSSADVQYGIVKKCAVGVSPIFLSHRLAIDIFIDIFLKNQIKNLNFIQRNLCQMHSLFR